MPTADRRPRARRKSDEPKLSGESLYRAMRAAAGKPEEWAALRPRAIRGLTHGNVSAEDAARMFDAFGRKPAFIPRPPPSGMTLADVEDYA